MLTVRSIRPGFCRFCRFCPGSPAGPAVSVGADDANRRPIRKGPQRLPSWHPTSRPAKDTRAYCDLLTGYYDWSWSDLSEPCFYYYCFASLVFCAHHNTGGLSVFVTVVDDGHPLWWFSVLHNTFRAHWASVFTDCMQWTTFGWLEWLLDAPVGCGGCRFFLPPTPPNARKHTTHTRNPGPMAVVGWWRVSIKHRYCWWQNNSNWARFDFCTDFMLLLPRRVSSSGLWFLGVSRFFFLLQFVTCKYGYCGEKGEESEFLLRGVHTILWLSNADRRCKGNKT